MRRPVRARVCEASAYADQLRYERRKPWGDRESRRILVRVAYSVSGKEYRSDVTLLSIEGEAPDSRPLIWYDPARPERITADGLVNAVLLLLTGLGFLSLAFRL